MDRSKQSPRTKFIHDGDLILIYENFCFANALIWQKTIENVKDGVDLLKRLYAFESDGNFPIALHEYPACYSKLQPLRLAPLLVHLLKHFDSVLSCDFKNQTRQVLNRLIDRARQYREKTAYEPLWERRYLALIGEKIAPGICFSSNDWAEELLNRQLQDLQLDDIMRLVHPVFGIYTGPSPCEQQDRFEPSATRLDEKINPRRECWSGSVGNWQIRQHENDSLCFVDSSSKGKNELALRYIWKGMEQLHSLVIPTGEYDLQIEESSHGIIAHFDLPELTGPVDNDLVEIDLFCNRSKEIEILVDGKKSTMFMLGQIVTIHSEKRKIQIRFEIEQGHGEFIGHLSHGNRPFQKSIPAYEAFDWRISLRTVRRDPVRLRLQVIA